MNKIGTKRFNPVACYAINNLVNCSKYAGTVPNKNDHRLLLYDTQLKRKVPLQKTNGRYLTMYSCGPTVYDVTHIGHASSYIRLDIIQRIMNNFFGICPVVAMCITDIDDKIINKANAEEVEFHVIARKYEIEFFSEMQKMNVKKPHFILRVTDHIQEIIDYIEKIIKKGHAYVLPGGSVYFNTQSLPNYGKVTKTPILQCAESKPGERLHPADFVLWKEAKPGEPSWPSPWGRGRPGWHIECSTLAAKIFGDNVNIHTGGLDLAFPHHENEEAQSCAYHSVKQWVDHWLHTGHLLMNGMKMSKSMKNFISTSEFLKEHRADHFRMLCLLTHYRTSIDYTEDVMTKPISLVNKFESFIRDARSYQKGEWKLGDVSPSLLNDLDRLRKTIIDALADDINTAKAVISLEEFVKKCSIMLNMTPPAGKSRDLTSMAITTDFIENFLMSLGLMESEVKGDQSDQDDFLIESALDFRTQVRGIALEAHEKETKQKLLTACDGLRSNLNAIGVTVKDTVTQISNRKKVK